VPDDRNGTVKHYQWASSGDVNAFFGLVLDNIADLVLAVGLLAVAFNFPPIFALSYMVPGTALGVLVGDLLFTWMAFRLARRTGRSDVTAMPLGLDTPSTFAMVLFVVGPAFLAGQEKFGPDAVDAAAHYAWMIGAGSIVISGLFKLVCAILAGWIHRLVPRAGLLGSLAAIALVLISFLPMLDMARFPVVGWVSLAVILTTLTARIPTPGRWPGALAALIAGTTIYYLMLWTGTLGAPPAESLLEPRLALELPWPTLGWIDVLRDSLVYLPIVIPFALATVVGGIDCTESAAAAGDSYDTRQIIAVEGLATVLAGLCGGVIQTTPYIGHPAYKAMGGRAAYTLATALFIGAAGMLGFFAYIYLIIPRAAIFPILIFVGLEISAQSFHATPRKHYPAVVLACVPALAYLVTLFTDNLMSQLQVSLDQLGGALGEQLQTLRILSGGFIVTSLLWASAAAAIIDHRLLRAACYFAVAAVCSLFGIIHSPLEGGSLLLPWRLPPTLSEHAAGQTPFYIATAYAAMALLMVGWQATVRPAAEPQATEPQSD